MEKFSICTFDIEEIPEFKFGLWKLSNIQNPESSYGPKYKDMEYILFSQAKLTLDKFKPSRSSLRVPVGRIIQTEVIDSEQGLRTEENEVVYTYEANRLFNFIKHNKAKAFYISGYSDFDYLDNISYMRALSNYIHTHLYYFKNDIKNLIKLNFIKNYIKLHLFNKNVRCALIDKGDNISPRLDLLILLPYNKENTSEYYKLDDYLDRFMEKMDKKFFMEVDITCKYSNEVKDYEKYLGYVMHEEDYKFLWTK